MRESNTNFLVFLHIQKTGGITLQRILRQKFGPSLPARTFKVLTGKGSPLSLEDALREKRMRDRYFAGHSCFGVHRLLPKPTQYITLLREPVSRIISLYDFSRTNPGAFYHNIANGISLEEFALNTKLRELDNGQTRFIAGDPEHLFINQTPFRQCDTHLLETAEKNIEVHFSLVGLTEQFDASMLLLSHTMGWKHCHYLRLNSSRHKEPVTEKLKAKIAEHNNLDVLLYQKMKKRFAQTLEKHDINREKIESFQHKNKKLNAYLGSPYKAYHQTKALLRGQAHRP